MNVFFTACYKCVDMTIKIYKMHYITNIGNIVRLSDGQYFHLIHTRVKCKIIYKDKINI